MADTGYEAGPSQEQVTLVMRGDSRSMVESLDHVTTATRNAMAAAAALHRRYKQLQDRIEQLGAWVRRAGYSLMATTAGMAYSGAQLEKSLLNVQTVTDDAALSVGNLTNELYRMSSGVPQRVGDLAETMYDIASAGYQGADALKVLKQSSVSASAGLTDTRVSARALTAIMASYGIRVRDIARLSDVLFQTVNVGVINFEELAASVGDWAALSSQAGVALTDATAAMAAMTLQGVSASESSTQLRMLMLSLIDPTEAMAEAINKLGYASPLEALKENAQGLQGVLNDLWMESGRNVSAFQQYFGEVRATNAALQLTGKNAEIYARTLAAVGNAAEVAGATQRALREQSKGLAYNWNILVNRGKEFASLIGRFIVPMMTMVVKAMSDLTNGTIILVKGVDDLAATFINMLPVIEGVNNPLARMLAGLQAVSGVVLTLAGLWIKWKAMGLIWRGVGIAGTFLLGKINQMTVAGTRLGVMIDALTHRFMRFNRVQKIANSGIVQWARSAQTAAFAAKAAALTVGGVTFAATLAADALSSAKNEARAFAESLASVENPLDDMSFDKTFDAMDAELARLRGQAGSFFEEWRGAYEDIINPFDNNETLTRRMKVVELLKEGQKLEEQQRNVAVNLDRISRLQAYWNTGVELSGKGWHEINTQVQEWLATQGSTPATMDPVLAMIYGTSEAAQAMAANFEAALTPTDQLREILGQPEFREFLVTEELTDDQIKDLVETLNDYVRTAASTGRVTDNLGQYMEVFSSLAKTAEDRVTALNDVLNGLTSPILSIVGAKAAFGDALRGIVEAVNEIKEGDIPGSIFDPMTEAGSKFYQSMETARGALVKLGVAAYQETGDMNQAVAAVEQGVEQLRQAGRVAGISEAEINKMIYSMGLTPEKIGVLIEIAGEDEAMAAIRNAQQAANDLDGTTATVTIGFQEDSAYRRSGGIGAYDPTTGQYMPPISGTGTITGKDTSYIKGVLATDTQVATKMIDNERRKGLMAAQDWAYAQGFLSNDAYIQVLRERQAAMESYSEEYVAIQTEIWQIQRDTEDRMYDYGKISKDRYIAILQERMQWMDVYSEAYLSTQQKIVDIQREYEDALFQNSQVSTAQYIGMLKTRLNTMERGSTEYIETVERIKDLTEDMSKRLYQNNMMNRQQYFQTMWSMLQSTVPFTEAWYDARDAVQEVFDELEQERAVFTDPLREATDILKNLSDQGKVTSTDIRSYFDHMIEGAGRWKAAIEELGARGLNRELLKQLAEMGPQGLNLAEEILRGGAASIGEVNRGYGELNNLINSTGLSFGGMFPSAKDTAPIQQNINLPAIDISINGKTDVVTAQDVTAAIVGAVGQLTESIRRS